MGVHGDKDPAGRRATTKPDSNPDRADEGLAWYRIPESRQTSSGVRLSTTVTVDSGQLRRVPAGLRVRMRVHRPPPRDRRSTTGKCSENGPTQARGLLGGTSLGRARLSGFHSVTLKRCFRVRATRIPFVPPASRETRHGREPTGNARKDCHPTSSAQVESTYRSHLARVLKHVCPGGNQDERPCDKHREAAQERHDYRDSDRAGPSSPDLSPVRRVPPSLTSAFSPFREALHRFQPQLEGEAIGLEILNPSPSGGIGNLPRPGPVGHRTLHRGALESLPAPARRGGIGGAMDGGSQKHAGRDLQKRDGGIRSDSRLGKDAENPLAQLARRR